MSNSIQRVDELFVMLPSAVMADPYLTPSDKLVYAALKSFANVKRGDLSVYPSVPTIATACAMSVSQVKASLARLSGKEKKPSGLRRKLVERQARTEPTVTGGTRPTSTLTTFLRISSVYKFEDLPAFMRGKPESGRGAGQDLAGGGSDIGSKQEVVEQEVSELYTPTDDSESEIPRTPCVEIVPPPPSKEPKKRVRKVPKSDPTRDQWLMDFRDWYIKECVPLGCPPCMTLTDEFRIKGQGAYFQTKRLETKPLDRAQWAGLKKGLESYPPDFRLSFDFGWFLRKNGKVWNAEKMYLRGQAKSVTKGSGFGGKLTPYEEDAKRRRDQERFQAKMERERGGQR